MILTTHIKEQGAGRRQWLYHREYNCGDKAFAYANTLAEKRAKAECYEKYTVKVEVAEELHDFRKSLQVCTGLLGKKGGRHLDEWRTR